ncbi:MAG: hypothetical protein PHG81_12035 [Aliarcobacter sp.]|nr:hypothetical protein [Aliarcobacter sp.]
MYLTNMIEQEQIILAKMTKDENILKQLAESMHISVRRSVAKNFSVPKRVLDRLCTDPSLNVTYVANKFCDDSKIKRDIISKNPCVVCTTDEREYINVCNNCVVLIKR